MSGIARSDGFPHEAVVLVNARAECLNLAVELEEAAAALRLVSLGRATATDRRVVRGLIDSRGEFIVRGVLDWELLLQHADRPAAAS